MQSPPPPPTPGINVGSEYDKLLNSKKNDYYNAKISELEKTADNSDAEKLSRNA